MTISHYYQKPCTGRKAGRWYFTLSIDALLGDNYALLLKPTSGEK